LFKEPLCIVLVQSAEDVFGLLVYQLLNHPSDGVSKVGSEALEVALGGD
jgi:hypothetical protein